MTNECTLVDYGSGNVFSVAKAFEKNGATVNLTDDPDKIRRAERLVLPGVGAFGRAAKKIRENNLDSAILEQISSGRPFLGICVGMQLLMENSFEFGNHKGLGIFRGNVMHIHAVSDAGSKLRVPIIGWNTLIEGGPNCWRDSPFENVTENSAFYFVHSYACCPEQHSTICATTKVGETKIVAAVRKENVTGVQFHPERSGNAGLSFLRSFLKS
jgi:glutamine amidotransferase